MSQFSQADKTANFYTMKKIVLGGKQTVVHVIAVLQPSHQIHVCWQRRSVALNPGNFIPSSCLMSIE